MPFLTALNRTFGNEGVYSADNLDPGGETFYGISRVYWPRWHGWKVIDLWDKTGECPDLTDEVREFYYENFWCRFQGDKVANISLEIAMEIFDTAVNLDPVDAVRFFQTSLNRQNHNETIYPDLQVDGLLGPKTIKTLSRYLQSQPGSPAINTEILLNCMNGEQYIHYISNPQHEHYRGWFRRL